MQALCMFKSVQTQRGGGGNLYVYMYVQVCDYVFGLTSNDIYGKL